MNNKYRAKSAAYGGHLYHSKKEALYAFELNMRVRAKELKSWRRQVHVPLKVNNVKVCSYIIDFVEEYPDGHERWVEIKGQPHPVGQLKIKMFRAQFPERDFVVIR